VTRVALAGNPNVGKTVIFNNLTGSRQRVGNWPGTTVEKKLAGLCITALNLKWWTFPGYTA